MNGFERIDATINHKECDRVPVFPMHHYSSSRVIGIKIGQYASNAELMARSVITAYKRFGYDAIMTGSDVAVEGEACGSIAVQPDDSPAYIVKPVIQKSSDLDNLDLPDPLKDGRMPIVIKATEICKKEIGKEAYITSPVMGPLNLSGQLRGIENLMLDIFDDEVFFEQLLDFALEVSIKYAKALIDAGSDMIHAGEALCSPAFIGPAAYRKFILKRHQRWAKELHDYGAKSTLIHVCGDISPILEDLGATGATCLDIDYKVNMRIAKEKTKKVVRGNLDPSSVLLWGTPEIVDAEAKKILLEAKEGGNLILGSGCDISPDTPFENIQAMVNASIKYGQYK